jgi:hypothetical protein
VTGNAGSNYVVQACINLDHSTWLALLTNASPFPFVDTAVSNYPQRFYRAPFSP